MCDIAPFRALRPVPTLAAAVASPPYDVLNTEEARRLAEGNPRSFLHVTRSEIDLPADVHVYSRLVYEKAKENLERLRQDGTLFREENACYYLYRLTMDGRSQTGLVCASGIGDYEEGLIRRHEFTRPEKEQDRIAHITVTRAQTGNVFLAYRDVAALDGIISGWTGAHVPVYDFTAADGIGHAVWVVDDPGVIAEVTRIFREDVPCTYIADGHHRAASAAKARQALGASADAGADRFLTTLFPAGQLSIMDYNRVVRDLNGHSPEGLLDALRARFTVETSEGAVKPEMPHVFGMYLGRRWYRLQSKPGTYGRDPVGVLDVSILSDNVLSPILGIHDQRTDKRIDFVGGIRGLGELEGRVDSGEMSVAFSLHPVSIGQLFDIADAGEVMPPKSTWFEPKLRDGLLTHLI